MDGGMKIQADGGVRKSGEFFYIKKTTFGDLCWSTNRYR